MSKIAKAARIIWQEVSWRLAFIKVGFTKVEENNAILLIPAGDLDGGFGEDIMVMSFIENFAQNKTVTIYTQNKIERDDYIFDKTKVRFVGEFLGGKDYLDALTLIKKHSLVYVIGADIMDGTYGKRLTLSRLRLLYLANKLGIDAQVSGFSISKNVKPIVKAQLIENSKFMVLKSRDSESYNRLLSFIPKERALLTNDMAFICPDVPNTYIGSTYNDYVLWTDSVKGQMKKIIGVCPNSIQARKIGLDNYVNDFKVLIEKFNKEGEYAFAFLYHDLRPLCGKENDSTISKTLYDYSKAKGYNCYYTDKIKSGVELKGYLSKIDFSLTGRMHFGISGITYGKPMFGIAYANKFEGMLKLFDINPSHCLVDYDKMKDSEKQITSFIEHYDNIVKKVSDHLDSVQTDTKRNCLPAKAI